jgi:N-acyl-L-homoserine lactone synthetase
MRRTALSTTASRALELGYKGDMGEFEVVVADTAELRNATFALRHEVYCREFGFEPVRADGLERDLFDDRAHHYLVAHVPTGAWAGCVRVVPGPDLPYEAMFGDVPVDLATVPHGEISRLTIARDFRRRPDHRPPAMLHAALVALAAVVANGMDDAVCVMEPRLAAQLTTFGIRLSRVSGLIDHRGDRALFHLDPVRTCREVRPDLRGVVAAIRSRIAVGHLTHEESMTTGAAGCATLPGPR